MSLTSSEMESLSNRLRLARREDAVCICYQVKRAIEKVPDALVVRNVVPERVAERIVSHQLPAVVIDNAYLIVYDVGSTWYSDMKYLEELMVLRIGPGSSFAAVCLTLEYLAAKNGCEDIHVGGALAHSGRAITRLYQRAGFEEVNLPSLIKRS